MLRLKSSTQVVTHGYRRFHTKIKKIYTAFTNSDSENKKQTNKQTNTKTMTTTKTNAEHVPHRYKRS